MLYGIAFTSLLCGMKVTANNCLSNSVWPEKCKTRCSFLELQMGHQWRNGASCIQAWYTPGFKKKKPLESILSSNAKVIYSLEFLHESFKFTWCWLLAEGVSSRRNLGCHISIFCNKSYRSEPLFFGIISSAGASSGSFPGRRSHMAQQICSITFPFLSFIQQNAISFQVA